LIQRALKDLIADNGIANHILVARTTAEASTLLETSKPSMILLDISLPDRSGFEFLKDLRQKENLVPVLILTMHNEDPYVKMAMDLGASGYLLKDADPGQLLEAIKGVTEGGRYFVVPKNKSQVLLDEHIEQSLFKELSTQEQKVAKAILSGSTLTEIAIDMDISIKTVSTYRSRILQKLHVKNNVEFIRLCLGQTLRTPEIYI
jgi:DNA-binding NarL/FixJ family response regulator